MASRLYQRYFEVVETPDHSNLCRYAIVLARLEESDDALAIIEMAFSVVREDDWSARAAVWEQKAVVDRILGDDVGAQMDMKEYEACSKKVVQ